jgi:hypothetical protein
VPKKRISGERQPARTMSIFCEGEKTEPFYIESYINEKSLHLRATVVQVVPTNKNTPVQLVECAIEQKAARSSLPGDSFWVVYDRESVAKYPERLHAEAWAKAKGGGIDVAISNVCFEYWLLLHFCFSTTPYSNFQDLISKSELEKHVAKHTAQPYSKADRRLFEALYPLIPLARQNAVRLNQQGIEWAKPDCRPYEINPYTGMPYLLDAIDGFT